MLRRLLKLAALLFVVLIGGRMILLIAASGTADAAEPGEVPALKAGEHRTAVVFGAGLERATGRPTLLLRDRVRAAEELLRAHKVDLLLMTGDNSIKGYNEPGAMRREAIGDGIPPASIAVDYGGDRTWDSCVRAHRVFGVRHAIVVSNDFHRARTVESCKKAGLAVDGAVGTSIARYRKVDQANWQARELLASWKAVYELGVHQPGIAVGGSRIDPYDPCAVWHSLSAEDRSDRPAGC